MTFDGAGGAIELLAGCGRPSELRFRRSPAVVSRICTGLLDRKPADRATPLDTLLTAIILLRTAADVGQAFAAAAERPAGLGRPH